MFNCSITTRLIPSNGIETMMAIQIDKSANQTRREPLALLLLTGIALVLSGIGPKDRLTWWLEVTPVLIAVPLLVFTYRHFPLTPLLYRLIFLHGLILVVGGHYTYAEVPAGYWVQELFHLSRNHYDRLGHFAQGFVPAMVVREILVRRSPLNGSKWLPFIIVCVCLAISAFYELIEWWSAVLWGGAAEAFLATQGDVWDTQWDMFLALVGAVIALLTLTKLHNRYLSAL
jgi:putative membrane protein